MKKFKTFILAASMLLIGGVAVAQTYSAAVPVKTQSQTQWCWATDSQCILEYYGTKKQQCEIVEYARSLKPADFGSVACCTNATKCNRPNEIKYNYGILGMLDHFGNIKSVASDGPISAAKIISELDAKRPFVIGIMWDGGGGHVVVGCAYNKSTSTMTVMDSWNGNGMTTTKYSSGSHLSLGSGGSWGETLVITTPFSTTGIADAGNSAKEVSIYPNPSEGNINITSTENMKSINIYNMAGQLVDTYTVAGDKTYSLKIATAGFYNVQVLTENGGAAYKKIVVSNN